MQEELVKYPTAKLAKEKGFDIPTNSYYFEDGEFKENTLKGTNGYYDDEYEFMLSEFNEHWNNNWLTKKTGDRCFGCSKQQGYLETFSAPTQSLLAKWLRDVHNVNFHIRPMTMVGFVCYYEIHILIHAAAWDEPKKVTGQTYEETLEIALLEALKLM